MKKYQYYLQYGQQFLWRTDNSALRAIHTMDCLSAIIERWLPNELECGDYTRKKIA